MEFNPTKEVLTIPVINHPIAWYGVLFALGFFVGFYIFLEVYSYALLLRPKVTMGCLRGGNRDLAASLNQQIESGEFACEHRLLRRAGRWLTPDQLRKITNRLALEGQHPEFFVPLKERAKLFTEKLTLYVLFGTLLGARLGDIIAYENIIDYLKNPVRILMTWEGGLSSHGGALGIMIALVFFCRVAREDWVTLIDHLVVPTAFAGGCIRIGNFINQEILGVVTDLPWAITFMNPMDGSPALPRHPVQLYESLFYFGTFAFLLTVCRRHYSKLGRGVLGGLFFVLVFGFRFFIEYLKENQSFYVGVDAWLNMGQILSIPCIVFGVGLLLLGRKGTTFFKARGRQWERTVR